MTTLDSLNEELPLSLYEVDTTPAGLGRTFYFCNESDSGEPLVHDGNVYLPIPIDSDGWELSTDSALPSPTITIANLSLRLDAVTTTNLSRLCLQYDDLRQSTVTRRRILPRNIGNPELEYPRDIYRVEQKTNENLIAVTWRLSSSLSLGNFQLPARIMMRDYCSWEFRGDVCGYSGSLEFDEFGNPVGAGEGVCPKTQRACIRYFGQGVPLPIGALPALDLTRV